MDPKTFVYSAVLLLVVASVAVVLFRHLGLGSILGLLVTGVIVGPPTPGPFLTTEVDGVRQFTELGVVLLLFLIGLEMKPRRLWEMRRMLFGLGTLQRLLSATIIAAYFQWFYGSWSIALLFGAGFALSSTAFVMQMLRDQGEIATRHGQTSFAILLMQDLAVVPLLALVPFMSRLDTSYAELPHWKHAAIAIAVVGLVVLGGRFFVPKILDYLARKNNREGFFLVALASMFIAALAMEYAGVSMALGAFLMGMMLSTSRYSLQIEATIEPHKGLLMSLFFVAVGMSVDVGLVALHPLEFTLHVLAIIVIKILVLYALCLVFKTGQSTALRVAFLLSQGGEFGFVLFGAAKALDVIDDHLFSIAVAVISLSMSLTPLLAKLGNSLALRTANAGAAEQADLHLHPNDTNPRVVIAGYGRVGHVVGTILAHSQIPYIAFDMDAGLVAKWRDQGLPVFYGDICNADLFNNPALHAVDLVVLTIDNGSEAVRAASLIRTQMPEVMIVARARDLRVCEALNRVGVRESVPETLEASLRLAAESLEALGISNGDTSLLLDGVRKADYTLERVKLEDSSSDARGKRA